MKLLLSRYDNYVLSVSMTTREPRPGEENGREYFFVTREQFKQTIAQEGLVEYASYCGHDYGTPRAYVEEQLAAGRDVILEIEIQGALRIKEQFPEALLLFVMPPSIAELERRLADRGTESGEVIRKRMARAVEEARQIEEYEYIIVNDDLEACVGRMHALIQAAHHTTRRNRQFIENIRKELDALSKGE